LTSQSVENASIRGLAIPFVEVRNLSPLFSQNQTGSRELKTKNWFKNEFSAGNTELRRVKN
jgi:hypothetical protein